MKTLKVTYKYFIDGERLDGSFQIIAQDNVSEMLLDNTIDNSDWERVQFKAHLENIAKGFAVINTGDRFVLCIITEIKEFSQGATNDET